MNTSFTKHRVSVCLVFCLNLLLASTFARGGAFLMTSSGTSTLNNAKVASLGHTVTQDSLVNIINMAPTVLAAYDVVWFNPNHSGADYSNLRTAVAPGGALEQYVNNGGVLVLCVAGNSSSQNDIAPGGVDYDRTFTHNIETFTTPTHPYLTGTGYTGTALVTTDFNSWGATDHGWLTNLPAGATTVLSNTDGASWVEYSWNCGTVIVNTLTYGWGADGARLSPQDNLINYTNLLVPGVDSDSDGICDAFDVCAGFSDTFDASPPFVGELSMRAAVDIPDGWLAADGQLLACADYPVLCSLLGNTYGGDLDSGTFAVPDLRGRAPMGEGAGPGLTNRNLGQEPGAETVILDVTQMASHDHTLRATNSSATQTQPAGNILATASTPQYLNASTSVVMGSDAIGASGSNAPHANVQPSLVMNFVIAADGPDPRFNTAGIVGEMRMTAVDETDFPNDWLLADGRLLSCSDFPALCEILGNTYGGDIDGSDTFALPDLRGRFPMGAGAGVGLTNRNLGDEPGAEAVILDVTQHPSHDHTFRATNSSATQTQPAGNVLATAATPQYLNASTSVVMGSDAIGASGSNAPHANIQPAAVINFMINTGDQLSQQNLNNSTPLAHFVGETRLLAADTASYGWLLANGSLQLCDDFPALCDALGNTFGGNLGAGTFALPDFRGRIPIGDGAGAGLTNRMLGQEPGAEVVILDVTQLPSHDHTLRATNSSATQTQPAGNIHATASTPQYLNASTSVTMGSAAIGSSGSNAPHANVGPSSVLNVMIAATAFDIDGDGIPSPCDFCLVHLQGDFNDDCINDMLDFAIYTETWLIDCNDTPANPACVP